MLNELLFCEDKDVVINQHDRFFFKEGAKGLSVIDSAAVVDDWDHKYLLSIKRLIEADLIKLVHKNAAK